MMKAAASAHGRAPGCRALCRPDAADARFGACTSLGAASGGYPSAVCSASEEYPLTDAQLAFVSLLLALPRGCGKKHEPQAATGESLPPAAVRVQKIETVKQPAVEEVVGTVQPKLRATIEAKVSGRITRCRWCSASVKPGDGAGGTCHAEIQARLDQAQAAPAG